MIDRRCRIMKASIFFTCRLYTVQGSAPYRIATVVESVFPVSLPPPAEPGLAGLGRAGPGRAGPLPAASRASERDRRQGFGAHDRAGLRHATGGRASERDQVSAHTTGPGFGTPLPQLIPRRRVGLCRFPRFVQLSPC